jgi:hypothetical protein
MVFNLTIGFNNLERKDDPKDPKQKKYGEVIFPSPPLPPQ